MSAVRDPTEGQGHWLKICKLWPGFANLGQPALIFPGQHSLELPRLGAVLGKVARWAGVPPWCWQGLGWAAAGSD